MGMDISQKRSLDSQQVEQVYEGVKAAIHMLDSLESIWERESRANMSDVQMHMERKLKTLRRQIERMCII